MSKKVLIVEDEDNLAKAVLEYLGHNLANVQVERAADGEEAWDKIPDADLIFLDIIMPKVTGLELLNRIRGDAKLKDKRVIMMTNLDRAGDRQTAEDLGVAEEDYLVKSMISLKLVADKIKEEFKL